MNSSSGHRVLVNLSDDPERPWHVECLDCEPKVEATFVERRHALEAQLDHVRTTRRITVHLAAATS